MSRRRFINLIAAGTLTTALNARSLFADDESESAPAFLRGQGESMACGTACVQMLLAYHGDEVERAEIDAMIRRQPLYGTNPDHILLHLQSKKYRTALSSGTTDQTLMQTLDQGVPVIALVDRLDKVDGVSVVKSEDFSLHYQFIYDYCAEQTGDTHRLTHILLCEPGGEGSTKIIPFDHFLRSWSHLKLGGFDTGIHRMMIAAVPSDDRAIVGNDGVPRKTSTINLVGTERWNAQGIQKLYSIWTAGSLQPKKK